MRGTFQVSVGPERRALTLWSDFGLQTVYFRRDIIRNVTTYERKRNTVADFFSLPVVIDVAMRGRRPPRGSSPR